eukprot:3391853-Rhodomonas_salina.2
MPVVRVCEHVWLLTQRCARQRLAARVSRSSAPPAASSATVPSSSRCDLGSGSGSHDARCLSRAHHRSRHVPSLSTRQHVESGCVLDVQD